MQEIGTGLWHWTAFHPRIGSEVSSYYLSGERVLIDPMLPPEGIRFFDRIDSPPQHVLLTCRHHDRDSWAIVDQFGAQVHCVEAGVDELRGRGPVTPFRFGDELPGGIVACEVAAISPDETALHLPAHDALACADGVVRRGTDGPLEFVPDSLMDEPERTKQALREAFSKLLALDFERLLLAHGRPLVAGGKQALTDFVAA